MPKDFDAIIYIRKPPSYTFKDGLFYVCYPIGTNASAEFVMQPNVFLKANKAARKAVADFETNKGAVVSMREGRGH